MSNSLKFTKMHGAGNDFIIINNVEEKRPIEGYGQIAKEVCRRKFSVGADGMIVVDKSDNADFKMYFYNADGSMGEMCGNGARCIARYGYEHGFSGETQRFETTAGIITGWRIDQNTYRIQLNSPSVETEDLKIEIDGTTYTVDYAELGDPGIPHVAIQYDRLLCADDEEIRQLGRKIRYYKGFPKGANVNFYSMIDDTTVQEKTYERGVEDLTLACGTGSGTVAYMLVKKKRAAGNRVCVKTPGGDLHLEIVNGNQIFLEGATCNVAEGMLELSH